MVTNSNDIRTQIKMTKYEDSRFTPDSDDMINHNSMYCSSCPYVIVLLFFGGEIEPLTKTDSI